MQILKLIYILLVLAPLSTLGQATFFNVYSSGHFDIGEGICQLADSSYLVTGSSGGFNATSPQAFVMKVSKKGKQIWTVNKGGEEAETGRRIFYINDTIYLFGRTNSFGNSYDYYFLKLDSLGNTIDEKTIGTPDFEWLQDVVFMPKDSTFVLYGYWQENNGFTRKRQLIKINRQGTSLWQREFPMHIEAQLKNAHAITDSTFAITGSEYNENRTKFDGLFYSFDLAGNIVDSLRYYQYEERDYCFNDFTFYTSNQIFISSNNILKTADSVIFMNCPVFRFTPSINETVLAFGGVSGETYYTSFEFIIRKRNLPDKYYVYENATKSLFQVFGDGHRDEQITLLSGYSDLYWEKAVVNVSAFGDDVTNQVITTLDGGIISVGYNEYYANNAQNVFLLKIANDDNTVNSFAHPSEESLLKITNTNKELTLTIFPNPVENIINISFDEDADISIVDLNGKHWLSTTDKKIDVSILQSGVYFLKINSQKSSRTIKFIKK